MARITVRDIDYSQEGVVENMRTATLAAAMCKLKAYEDAEEEGRLTMLPAQTTVRLAGIIPHSFVNGPGTRFTIFFQGCPHFCQKCQNPETWNISGGTATTVDDILAKLTAPSCSTALRCLVETRFCSRKQSLRLQKEHINAASLSGHIRVGHMTSLLSGQPEQKRRRLSPMWMYSSMGRM